MSRIKPLVPRIYSKVNKNSMNLIIRMIFHIKVSFKILVKLNLISRVLQSSTSMRILKIKKELKFFQLINQLIQDKIFHTFLNKKTIQTQALHKKIKQGFSDKKISFKINFQLKLFNQNKLKMKCKLKYKNSQTAKNGRTFQAKLTRPQSHYQGWK